MWDDVEKPDKVIFDMRSEEEKKCVKMNRNTHTFKKNADVWQDRP